jgi:multiple sugar transport system substrate-binding protein
VVGSPRLRLARRRTEPRAALPWETLAKDAKANPPDKYAVLGDSLDWATAVEDVYSTWVLNTMFAQAATGALSPEEAVKEAGRKCHRIWEKWKERRLI